MENYNENIIEGYKKNVIVLYGASLQGKNILKMFLRVNITPKYFCDSDLKKVGKKIDGIEVISIEKLRDLSLINNNLKIIISSVYIDEIMDNVIKNNIMCNIEPYYYTQFIFSTYFSKENIKRISLLKNKYQGMQCFIIGNGPSLLSEDLERLKDQYTFASNKIYLMFDKTSWRPDFYGGIDSSTVNRDNIEKVKEISCKNMFLLDKCQYEREIYNLNNVFYLKGNEQFDRNKPKFDYDITKPMYFLGITFTLIEIAIYMGFKKIYLLGVDMTYATPEEIKNNDTSKYAFCKEYINEEDLKQQKALLKNNYNYEADMKLVRKAYEIQQKDSEKMGVKIYNCTRGGKLEAFERADFDKVISELKDDLKLKK